MTVFDESDLTFEFDDRQWRIVIKWDETPEYRDGIGKALGKTKAVDFACVDRQSRPWLIEVKNYTLAVALESPLADLADALAWKIRDSLASICFAKGAAPRSTDVESIAASLRSGSRIFVVAWIEDDKPLPVISRVALTGLLRKRLVWLSGMAPLLVASRFDTAPGVPGLKVS